VKKLKTAIKSAAHGSDLTRAVARYGDKDWLDLSSAVSPYSWWAERADDVFFPAADSQALPEVKEGLREAIVAYYGEPGLPTAGSQAAIRSLPLCFDECAVWVVRGSYGEHALSWAMHGHHVQQKSIEDIRHSLQAGDAPDVLIVVNPDNPTGYYFSQPELLEWASVLEKRGGVLICDEAFMDATQPRSLLGEHRPENAIILRSLGKFFGLAGIRFGTVFAESDLLATLASYLGPWGLSSLTLRLAEQALIDRAWQSIQFDRLKDLQTQMSLVLSRSDAFVGCTPLFLTLRSECPLVWQDCLANQGIWTRAFPQQGLLRLGYPLSDQVSRTLDGVLTLPGLKALQ
jgi:cobalamin biosynthetic protein CobC